MVQINWLTNIDSLIEHVTHLFKWLLRTGKIPDFLLVCTLVPIVKDNLGDIATSDNYRAIAIGSLLLKWFDWLILILESDKLTSDELQFGFQEKSSTTMCTWAISTVADYYNIYLVALYLPALWTWAKLLILLPGIHCFGNSWVGKCPRLYS